LLPGGVGGLEKEETAGLAAWELKEAVAQEEKGRGEEMRWSV